MVKPLPPKSRAPWLGLDSAGPLPWAVEYIAVRVAISSAACTTRVLIGTVRNALEPGELIGLPRPRSCSDPKSLIFKWSSRCLSNSRHWLLAIDRFFTSYFLDRHGKHLARRYATSLGCSQRQPKCFILGINDWSIIRTFMRWYQEAVLRSMGRLGFLVA